MKLDLNMESVYDILTKVLLTDLELLEADLKEVKRTEKGWIFSKDWEEDVKEITKLRKAMVKVLGYYGTPSDVVGLTDK